MMATAAMHTNDLPRQLRVLHMVDVLTLAGMEYGVIKVLNRLDPVRFAPYIGCLRMQSPETTVILDSRIPVFEFHKQSGRDWRIVRELTAVLKRERIDVVHSHNWGTYFYTMAAAKWAGTPVVVHGEHGREDQAIPARQLLISRHLARGASQFVAVSKSLCDDLVTQWGLAPERVTYIPNGVDTDVFGRAYTLDSLREEFRLTPRQAVILSIGRYRKVKDHPTLVRAFARVHRRYPEARLVIVGGADSMFHDISEQYRRESQAVARELGVDHAIRYSGDRRDVPELLALCDVYVNTSRFEGMSNTILEAMASRKPVVATAVGGTPYLVQDGVTGFLAQAGDDEEVAAHIMRLLADPSLASRIGLAGRAMVEQRHSMNAMVRANGDLYQELYARWNARRRISPRARAKAVLAKACTWSGVTAVVTRANANRLKILTYHRVVPLHDAQRYPLPSLVLARDEFEAQMAYLRRRYRVLPLHDALKRLENEELPPRSVAVTFDDGYADNFHYAWPVMKKYEIPGALFVVTGVLDRTHCLWWDALWKSMPDLLQAARDRDPRLEQWPAEVRRILQQGCQARDLALAVRSMGNYINTLPRNIRLPLLKSLLHNVNTKQVADELMLTWDDVRTMHREGMEIGSHSISHAFMDELDQSEIQEEIGGSIRRLESQIGTKIRYFAYPKGRLCAAVKRQLEQMNLDAALSTDPGQNGPSEDRYHLKRLDAGFSRMPGGFLPAVFDAEINGVFSCLR